MPGPNEDVVIDTTSPNAPELTNTPTIVNNVTVGDTGTATLSILEGGELTFFDLAIGDEASSNGAITVSGSEGGVNSQLIISGNFIVGNAGNGALTVSDGGQVGVDQDLGSNLGLGIGSTAKVQVTGAGSALLAGGDLHVGVGGMAMLDIQSGATVNVTNSNTSLYIGEAVTGDGEVTVSGSGTTLTIAADTYVGDQGNGTLTVLTGGQVTSGGDGTDFFIGNAAGSVGNVLVSGTGSILSAQGDLHVGYEGKGTLDIQSGGTVAVIGSSGNLEIGKGSDGVGTVKVSGTGATLVTDKDIVLGVEGVGTLIVNSGGSLVVDDGNGEIELATSSGSQSTLVIGAPSGSAPLAPGTVSADRVIWKGIGSSLIVFNHTADETDNAVYDFDLPDASNISVEAGYTTFAGGTGPIGGELVIDGGTFRVIGQLVEGNTTVGDTGTGATLIVAEGGFVQNTVNFIAGNEAGSSGTVLVSGTGSRLEVGGVASDSNPAPVIGRDGTGTLIVANGGVFETKDTDDRIDLVIAENDGSIGLVAIGSPRGQSPAGPGTLEIDKVKFGDGAGTLLFNHSDDTGDYEFDRGIENNGTLQVEAGYTELSSDSSAFSGTTMISGGTLAVTDKLGGTVTVSGSGTLAGTGELSGAITVKSGGTIAPGTSVGTLKTGEVTFDTGSFFDVEIDSDGNSDLLDSDKIVTIDGGTVTVTADSYSDDATFTILTSENGTAGVFDSVSGSKVFVDYSLSYDGKDVLLRQLVARSFGSVATTANHRAVAGALDSTPTEHAVVQSLLDVETEEEARHAFDMLSGEIHASIKGVLMDGNRQITDAVNRRLTGTFSGPEATFAYGHGQPADDPPNAAWVSAYGGWSDVDSTANTAALDTDLGGIVAGLDREVGKIWRLGLLGAYGHANITQSGPSASATTDSYSAGVYGAAGSGAWHVNFGGLYSWHDIDSSRTVGFGRLSETLTASYDAQSWQLFAEAGYEMQVNGTGIQPFAGISFMQLDTDGYTESGGVAALTAASDSNSTTYTTLGVRASRKLAKAATLQVMAGWRHAFGDIDPTATLALTGGPPFVVTGAPIAQDALAVELGFDYAVSNRLTLSAG